MSELTKEDVDQWKENASYFAKTGIGVDDFKSLCDAALRGIEASTVKHESDALEYSLAMVLADIRIKTGVGVEPMLTELADVLAAKIAAKDARIAKVLK